MGMGMGMGKDGDGQGWEVVGGEDASEEQGWERTGVSRPGKQSGGDSSVERSEGRPRPMSPWACGSPVRHESLDAMETVGIHPEWHLSLSLERCQGRRRRGKADPKQTESQLEPCQRGDAASHCTSRRVGRAWLRRLQSRTDPRLYQHSASGLHDSERARDIEHGLVNPPRSAFAQLRSGFVDPSDHSTRLASFNPRPPSRRRPSTSPQADRALVGTDEASPRCDRRPHFPRPQASPALYTVDGLSGFRDLAHRTPRRRRRTYGTPS